MKQTKFSNIHNKGTYR